MGSMSNGKTQYWLINNGDKLAKKYQENFNKLPLSP